MGYDGYITIGTKLDTSGIDANIGKLQRSLESKTTQMSNTMTKTFNLLKTTIIGVGIGAVLYGITRELDNAISRVDTLNNFANVMGNLGIASKDAEDAINYLSDKLMGLPTTLDAAALSVQRFTSANGNIKASTEMFLALNNAVLAGGANMQLQQSAIEQLSQAYAKGKPDMMEWRTIMMAMPAQMKQVASVMGYDSADSLGTALRNGTVSMNEFMLTLIKMNREGLGGFKSLEEQARNATGGIQTSIANLKTAISRGLANVVNAIGQTNIAEFINKIAKAINTASLYVAAFIKLIMTAINAIGALFGKKTAKATSNTKKDVQGASVSMGGLSDSAGTASDNLGKATGNAKKLKKELKQIASFDEMNVLNKNNTTNSGAGGSGGGAGGGSSNLGDLSGLDFGIEQSQTAADKINDIFEKMKTQINNAFGNINLKPLADSLILLWKSAKPLATLTWDNLVWTWNNILVPLGKWTIEDYLPRWIRNAASGLKIIRPIFEVISNVAKELYNNVLKPFARTVGDNLLDVLDLMYPILEKIGKWVRNHKPLIEAIFKVIIYTNPLVILITLLNKVSDALEYLSDLLYEYTNRSKTVEGTQKRINELEKRAKHATDDYNSALKDKNRALKDLQEAERKSKISGEELYNAIRSGKTSYDKLTESQQKAYDAYVDLKEAEGKIKASENDLKDIKEKLKKASDDNAEAVLKEKGNYDEYKKSVVSAYESGKIKAPEAQQKISQAMKGMSADSRKTFVQDLPSDIKKGLDTKQYENSWTGFKSKWQTSFLNKIPTKIALNVIFPGTSTLLTSWNKIMNLFKKNSTIDVKIQAKGGGGKGSTGSGGKTGGRAKGGIFYPTKLPKLAVGGIVNMPGKGVPYNGAIIGERGAEAVVPLTDSQQMALLGEAIGKWITVNANITTTMNGRVISRELQKVQNEDDFAFNR